MKPFSRRDIGTVVVIAMLVLPGMLRPDSLSTTPSPNVTLGTTSGVLLTDSATLSGATNPTGTITFTLSFQGSVFDTEATTVNGNGTNATPVGFTLPTSGTVAGTYTWDATYNGNNPSVSSNGESVVVSQASPMLNTTPGGAVILGSGAILSDTAILSR